MTQLFPNPSVGTLGIRFAPSRCAVWGTQVKLRALIGMLALVGMIAPVFAQDNPVPLPRRADRMPANVEMPAEGESLAADQQETGEPSTDEAIVPEITPEAAASAAAAAAEAFAARMKPHPVTLMARVTDQGAALPDGVTWRVFETRTDAAGDLILARKTNDATARLELPAGEYVVHLSYGRAQITDTLTVGEGENTKQLVLDAGAMRLSASVVGDVPIPINLLRFDIYSSGSESNRTLIAQNLSSSDIVTLNAGTYHIVSYFGSVNAVVRADLRVEPGQLTDATLYHKAAQISFKLVSEAGGEAIADIDWTVKTTDGQTIFTDTGAFPSTVLGEGEYLVLAKRGDQVYNREFEVQPGAPREIEVLTAVY